MPHPRLFLLLGLASCAAAAPDAAPALIVAPPQEAYQPNLTQESFETYLAEEHAWKPGQFLMQGFVGVSSYDDVSIDGDDSTDDDVDGGDLEEVLLIGGGGQCKLGGRRIDWGLEGLLSFSGRADAEAFVVGGGGAVVAVDVDLLIFELYGGPFASAFLGEKLRVYGAAGPLLQFADYDQSGSGLDDDGSGFGNGWYGRTGFEFMLPSRTLIGLGVRWSDTSVDLGSIGHLEMDGFQGLVTVSRGI